MITDTPTVEPNVVYYYILEYWYTKDDEDGIENLAVSNRQNALKNSKYINIELENIKSIYRESKVEIGPWIESNNDFILGAIRAPLLVTPPTTKKYGERKPIDFGFFVIRPVPFVDGDIELLKEVGDRNRDRLEEFVHSERIRETERHLEREFGLEDVNIVTPSAEFFIKKEDCKHDWVPFDPGVSRCTKCGVKIGE